MAQRPHKKARTSSCSRPVPPWSALPLDLAGEVLRRLPAYADRVCFGAVCRAWRYSARKHPTPPLLPCLCFADGTFRGFPEDDRPFRLPAAAGYHSSCGEWLVFEHGDGSYSLMNPFSKATMAPLPSLSRVHVRHDTIVAVAERVLPEYNLHRRIQRDGEPQMVSVLKLVVCSARLVAAVIGEGQLGTFALCRPGAPSWSMIAHDQCWRQLKDMTMYQGKLYAVDHNEDLLAITVVGDNHGVDDDPAVSRIHRVIEGAPPSLDPYRRFTLHYLVESGGELLLVRREICRARPPRSGTLVMFLAAIEERFTVFKADFRSSRWSEMSTVGDDRALFVGRWCSRAVRVPDERCEEWANRIFFLEDGIGDEWPERSRRYSLSVYHMNRKGFAWCCYPPRWGSEPLLPVMSRDGDDLPATWLFPQAGKLCAAAR